MLKSSIYHITHIENLASILSQGKIWCDSKRRHLKFDSLNIGYSHIKERRLKRAVEVAANGTLGDYVPFYCGNNETKELRQAEFLIHDYFSWDYILEIGVINQEIKAQVLDIIKDSPHKPDVKVQQAWYY